jgi:hypothetical protein
VSSLTAMAAIDRCCVEPSGTQAKLRGKAHWGGEVASYLSKETQAMMSHADELLSLWVSVTSESALITHIPYPSPLFLKLGTLARAPSFVHYGLGPKPLLTISSIPGKKGTGNA